MRHSSAQCLRTPIAASRRNSVPTPHRAALILRPPVPTLRRAGAILRRVAAEAVVAPPMAAVAVDHMAVVVADVTNLT